MNDDIIIEDSSNSSGNNNSNFDNNNFNNFNNRCPNCGGSNVNSMFEKNQKNYNFCNGIFGYLCMGGPLGLLCGLCGTGTKVRVYSQCGDCGARFSSNIR